MYYNILIYVKKSNYLNSRFPTDSLINLTLLIQLW